ncbi:MAG TPA: hypothetical protein VGG67_04495 [Steroidobacteraceae bacterium]
MGLFLPSAGPRIRISNHRQDWLPSAALLLLGSLAFIRLLALPAFEDEGTEMRWIWRVIEAGEWLQPLADGKATSIFVKLLHSTNQGRAAG